MPWAGSRSHPPPLSAAAWARSPKEAGRRRRPSAPRRRRPPGPQTMAAAPSAPRQSTQMTSGSKASPHSAPCLIMAACRLLTAFAGQQSTHHDLLPLWKGAEGLPRELAPPHWAVPKSWHHRCCRRRHRAVRRRAAVTCRACGTYCLHLDCAVEYLVDLVPKITTNSTAKNKCASRCAAPDPAACFCRLLLEGRNALGPACVPSCLPALLPPETARCCRHVLTLLTLPLRRCPSSSCRYLVLARQRPKYFFQVCVRMDVVLASPRRRRPAPTPPPVRPSPPALSRPTGGGRALPRRRVSCQARGARRRVRRHHHRCRRDQTSQAAGCAAAAAGAPAARRSQEAAAGAAGAAGGAGRPQAAQGPPQQRRQQQPQRGLAGGVAAGARGGAPPAALQRQRRRRRPWCEKAGHAARPADVRLWG